MQTTLVACPLCHTCFRIAESSPVGKGIRCHKCGAPFTVATGDLRREQTPTSKPGGSANAGPVVDNEPWWVQAQALDNGRNPRAGKDESGVNAKPGILVNSSVRARAGEKPPAAKLAAAARPRGPRWDATRVLLVGGVGLIALFGVSVAAALAFLGSGDELGKDLTVAASQEKPAPGKPAAPALPADQVLKQKAEQPPPEGDQQPPPLPDIPPQPPANLKAKEPAKDTPPRPNPNSDAAGPRPALADKRGVKPALQKQIDDAIDKGVKFLMNEQGGDGRWAYYVFQKKQGKENYPIGPTALVALTLLECGISANDPAMVKAASIIRRGSAENQQTYELSLAVLFLDKLGDKKDKPIIQALALRLLAGQTQRGGWGYTCPILTSPEATQLLTTLTKNRPKMPTAVEKAGPAGLPTNLEKPGQPGLPSNVDKSNKPVVPNAVEKPRYPPLPPDDGTKPGKGGETSSLLFDRDSSGISAGSDTVLVGLQPPKGPGQPPGKGAGKGSGLVGLLLGMDDNSNTQFAMLGLWAARRHDIPVERALALAEKRFHLSQFSGGSWGYHLHDTEDKAKRSMTCVGLLGLALGNGSKAELALRGGKQAGAKAASVKAPQIDAQTRKGLRALVLDNTQIDYLNSLYFMWSLERIGVLYEITTIGGRDWYLWGAGLLLPAQRGNGYWETHSYPGSNPIHDTCFALLFLKRVNLVQDLTDLNLRVTIVDPDGVLPKGP